MVYSLSINNSTNETLVADAVFTGEFEDVCKFTRITVAYTSSVASATDGLSLQFSSNGYSVDQETTYTVSTTGESQTLDVTNAYFRVVYTNGASTQVGGHFRLQTIYRTL